MIGEALTIAASTVWFEIALVIFLAVFFLIVAWVALARPGAFRDAARIPLDDDVVTPRNELIEKERGDVETPRNEA